MPSHTAGTFGPGVRTHGPEPARSQPQRPTAGPLPAGLGTFDEILGDTTTQEYRPVFEGNEASRSAQTFAELTRLDVPDGSVVLLDEVMVSPDSNGEIIVSVQGEDPVSWSGAIDVNLPFGGALLYGGQRVRVLHQSTDGSSATNRAAITGREV